MGKTSERPASLHLKAGEPGKAAVLAERALERVNRDLAPNNPATLSAMVTLASVYSRKHSYFASPLPSGPGGRPSRQSTRPV